MNFIDYLAYITIGMTCVYFVVALFFEWKYHREFVSWYWYNRNTVLLAGVPFIALACAIEEFYPLLAAKNKNYLHALWWFGSQFYVALLMGYLASGYAGLVRFFKGILSRI